MIHEYTTTFIETNVKVYLQVGRLNMLDKAMWTQDMRLFACNDEGIIVKVELLDSRLVDSNLQTIHMFTDMGISSIYDLNFIIWNKL